jgi:hypothetical protein
MKLGHVALAMLLGAVGVAAAQDKGETKVSVEDGKTITVTGCVARGDDGTFTLTNVAGKDGVLGSYILADADKGDLEKHVGHRVEVTGKAADKGKGKIKVETKNETKTDDGDKAKTESKSEVKGDLKGLPFLGVKSLRMLATVCP